MSYKRINATNCEQKLISSRADCTRAIGLGSIDLKSGEIIFHKKGAPLITWRRTFSGFRREYCLLQAFPVNNAKCKPRKPGNCLIFRENGKHTLSGSSCIPFPSWRSSEQVLVDTGIFHEALDTLTNAGYRRGLCLVTPSCRQCAKYELMDQTERKQTKSSCSVYKFRSPCSH